MRFDESIERTTVLGLHRPRLGRDGNPARPRSAARARAERPRRRQAALHHQRRLGNHRRRARTRDRSRQGAGHFVYNGEPTVSARFTIYGRSGSISGRAKARLSNPTSPDPSFRGAFTITGGSGRYAHIHGTGELFGVFYRRGSDKYGLVVQTIGKLPY